MKLILSFKMLLFFISISSAAAFTGLCPNNDDVDVKLPEERTYYFDAESGNNVNKGLDTDHPFRN